MVTDAGTIGSYGICHWAFTRLSTVLTLVAYAHPMIILIPMLHPLMTKRRKPVEILISKLVIIVGHLECVSESPGQGTEKDSSTH